MDDFPCRLHPLHDRHDMMVRNEVKNKPRKVDPGCHRDALSRLRCSQEVGNHDTDERRLSPRELDLGNYESMEGLTRRSGKGGVTEEERNERRLEKGTSKVSTPQVSSQMTVPC